MPRHRRARAALLILVAIALAIPGAASADPGNPIRPARKAPAPRADVATSLIVTYESGTSAARRAAVRQAESLDDVMAIPGRNAEVVRPRGRSLAAAMAAIASRPGVASVQPNPRRTAFADPTGEPLWQYQWGHDNTGQTIDDGWNPPTAGTNDVDVDGKESLARSTGSKSVVVAVIDDGVDFSHPDLKGAAWVNPGESGAKATNGIDDDHNGYIDDVNGWDFCNNDNSVHDFNDDFHGTAVAGVIAAQINQVGVAGIAPDTRIMALKFLSNTSANPYCNTDATAIKAIEYARSFGVRIINASWGGDGASPALQKAIEGSGALFVAAAGNGGPDQMGDDIDEFPTYPAAFPSPNIVTVAAIDNTGALTSFSNYGRVSVDLAAPGQSILLPCPRDRVYPAGWCWMDGTSFSAPYVTGIAALVGASRRDLLDSTPNLRRRVLETGERLSAADGKTASGRLVNAHRSIDFEPPKLTSEPTLLPYAGSTLGSTTIKVRLGWSAPRGELPTDSYLVEQRRNGGAWTTLAPAATNRFVDLVISHGTKYEFRVTPRDSLGNLGGVSPTATFTTTRYEEGTALVARTGTWRTASSTASSGGKTLYTTASGATATLTFNGRAAAFVAPRSKSRSSFKVYLDGKLVKTVSLYASSGQNRVVVYGTPALAYGRHTLRLVHVRVGSRIRADIDAFVVFR